MQQHPVQARVSIRKNRRTICLVVAVVTLAVTAKLGLRYWNFAPMAFQHDRWVQAREDEDWRVRTKMAKYLVNDKELVGQSRDQVLQLLGEPEHYSPLPGEPDTYQGKLYYLIREDWDWIDPSRQDHLLIFFDKTDRALEARIDVLKIRQ